MQKKLTNKEIKYFVRTINSALNKAGHKINITYYYMKNKAPNNIPKYMAELATFVNKPTEIKLVINRKKSTQNSLLICILHELGHLQNYNKIKFNKKDKLSDRMRKKGIIDEYSKNREIGAWKEGWYLIKGLHLSSSLKREFIEAMFETLSTYNVPLLTIVKEVKKYIK